MGMTVVVGSFTLTSPAEATPRAAPCSLLSHKQASDLLGASARSMHGNGGYKGSAPWCSYFPTPNTPSGPSVRSIFIVVEHGSTAIRTVAPGKDKAKDFNFHAIHFGRVSGYVAGPAPIPKPAAKEGSKLRATVGAAKDGYVVLMAVDGESNVVATAKQAMKDALGRL